MTGNSLNQETVIIIGAARSGTKFLRDTLAASRDVFEVPYDVNYIWRHGNEASESDHLNKNKWSIEISQYIDKSLRKISGVGKKMNSGILLDKTVNNVFRVEFVRKVYPNAIYIHLIRDGRDVVESSFRQWRNPPPVRDLIRKIRTFPLKDYRYAIWYAKNIMLRRTKRKNKNSTWGPRYPGILDDVKEKELIEVCSLQWAKSIQYSQEGFKKIDKNKYLEIKYEDLVSNEYTIRNVCDFVGVRDKAHVISVYRNTLNHNNVGKYQSGFSEVEKEKVNEIIGSKLIELGYL